jgi:hypothetical protein
VLQQLLVVLLLLDSKEGVEESGGDDRVTEDRVIFIDREVQSIGKATEGCVRRERRKEGPGSGLVERGQQRFDDGKAIQSVGRDPFGGGGSDDSDDRQLLVLKRLISLSV